MQKQGKTDKKKLAAAMAAVFAYMKTNEEAAAMQAAQDGQAREPEPLQGPPAAPNVWGMAGRQSMMQANTMMQLRLFK
ncbi:hypothetical protein [Desulfospira joergensenii]|uniref:hypothetical protein n=1 Tax=Desulfospira joergensenii TaxID=53329 RepID=UPI0003B47FF2|nr:hypothetical protein [Desulfospira joergensenii]